MDEIPQSLISERVILSNLLSDSHGDAIASCSGLKVDHFSLRSHKIVFRAILKLLEANKSIDLVSVTDYLQETKELEEVGGAHYISKLYSEFLTVAHTKDHVEAVKNKSKLRKLIDICENAKASIKDPNANFNEVLNHTESELFNLQEASEIQDNQLEQAYQGVKRMIEIRKQGIETTGLLSGIKSFDDAFFGFQKSQYYVLAGRPSSGKTAFADQVCGNLLLKDKCVLYISLESDRERLLSKLACKIANVSFWNFRRNKIKSEDLLSVEKVLDILHKKNLILIQPYDLGPSDIRPLIRKWKRKSGIDLVILDYIQKINIPSGLDERRAVSLASLEIQRACIQCELPALVLAQLNREAEGTRPYMRNLKESGQIEQDADNIAMLWSDVDKRDLAQDAIDHPCYLSIEKNKDGASSLDAEMNFEMRIMKFKSKI